MAETKQGGPYPKILEQSIFVNCIYLSQPINPFIDTVMLDNNLRELSVIADVSCDATNPYNPIPVYYGATTFDNPLISVKINIGKQLDVIAIDHLPSLLPREASESFCNDLLPYLLEIQNGIENSPVWVGAQTLYNAKVEEMSLE
jgi:saccharopine dehydrogenase (NAD+, L-lysine-forming)